MQHEYGKTEDPMGVLKITSKGRDMGTWEQLHIYRLNKKKLKVSEQHMSENDIHFKLVLRHKHQQRRDTIYILQII
jgi:hypothetical protein